MNVVQIMVSKMIFLDIVPHSLFCINIKEYPKERMSVHLMIWGSVLFLHVWWWPHWWPHQVCGQWLPLQTIASHACMMWLVHPLPSGYWHTICPGCLYRFNLRLSINEYIWWCDHVAASFCQYVWTIDLWIRSWYRTVDTMILICSLICVNAILGDKEVIVSIFKIVVNHSKELYCLCCFIVACSCLLYLLML